MPAITPWYIYAIFALACFLTGFSKGALGGGLTALLTPMLSLVMPPDQALGMMLPVLMIGDLFAVGAYWRKWNNKIVVGMLAGTPVGVTLGTILIVSLSALYLRRFLAVVVLLFVIYRLFEKRLTNNVDYQSRTWHAVLAGTVAGFFSTLAHAGGPPVTIYLLLQKVTPQVFVACSAIFLFALNWLKVPYYLKIGLLDLRGLLPLIWLLPLIPLGVWAGKKLVHRIDSQLFEKVITALLLITAVLLLLKS